MGPSHIPWVPGNGANWCGRTWDACWPPSLAACSSKPWDSSCDTTFFCTTCSAAHSSTCDRRRAVCASFVRFGCTNWVMGREGGPADHQKLLCRPCRVGRAVGHTAVNLGGNLSATNIIC